ncbi:hypothetical protein AB3N59_04125 [Leptospira sp. WS92.C1]
MKLILYTALLFFAAAGVSYNSLYATSVVLEADFELFEDFEIQNSHWERSSVSHSFDISLETQGKNFDVRSLIVRNNHSFDLELDLLFLDSLQSFLFVRDSIFGIVSGDFASSWKQHNFSSPSRSSLFAGPVFFDLFLPEKNRKKLLPLVSTAFSSFFGDSMMVVDSVWIPSRLSYQSFLDRKLLRYYAIRSDGPPYLSLKQVCV